MTAFKKCTKNINITNVIYINININIHYWHVKVRGALLPMIFILIYPLDNSSKVGKYILKYSCSFCWLCIFITKVDMKADDNKNTWCAQSVQTNIIHTWLCMCWTVLLAHYTKDAKWDRPFWTQSRIDGDIFVYL